MRIAASLGSAMLSVMLRNPTKAREMASEGLATLSEIERGTMS
jgi:hypothetical protein